jgi:VanZ family protein
VRPVTNLTIFGFRLAVVVLVAYWLALFTGTHLPAVMDFSPEVNDKIKHFGAFFVLGFLMCYVTNSPLRLKRFLTIAAIGMTYAAIDEMTQYFIPGRYPDRMDFVADSIGLWSAIVFYVIARHFYYSKQTTPSAESA